MSVTKLFNNKKRSYKRCKCIHFDDCEYEFDRDHYVLVKINKKIVKLPEIIYDIPVTEIGIIRTSNYDINEIHLILNENVEYKISIDFNKLGLIKTLTCNNLFSSRQIIDVVNIDDVSYVYDKKRNSYIASDKNNDIIYLFGKKIE